MEIDSTIKKIIYELKEDKNKYEKLKKIYDKNYKNTYWFKFEDLSDRDLSVLIVDIFIDNL